MGSPHYPEIPISYFAHRNNRVILLGAPVNVNDTNPLELCILQILKM